MNTRIKKLGWIACKSCTRMHRHTNACTRTHAPTHIRTHVHTLCWICTDNYVCTLCNVPAPQMLFVVSDVWLLFHLTNSTKKGPITQPYTIDMSWPLEVQETSVESSRSTQSVCRGDKVHLGLHPTRIQGWIRESLAVFYSKEQMVRRRGVNSVTGFICTLRVQCCHCVCSVPCVENCRQPHHHRVWVCH